MRSSASDTADGSRIPPGEWAVDSASNGVTDLESLPPVTIKPKREPNAYLTADVVRALLVAGLLREELPGFLRWTVISLHAEYPNGFLRHLINSGEIKITLRLYRGYLSTRTAST